MEVDEESRLTARANAVLGRVPPDSSATAPPQPASHDLGEAPRLQTLGTETKGSVFNRDFEFGQKQDLTIPDFIVSEILSDFFLATGKRRESVIPESGDHEIVTQTVYHHVLNYIAGVLGDSCYYDVEDRCTGGDNAESRQKMDFVFRLKKESRRVLATVVAFMDLKRDLGEEQHELVGQCAARVRMILACQPDRASVLYLQGDFGRIEALSSKLDIEKSAQYGGFSSYVYTRVAGTDKFWYELWIPPLKLPFSHPFFLSSAPGPNGGFVIKAGGL